jgi:hypothetical protein
VTWISFLHVGKPVIVENINGNPRFRSVSQHRGKPSLVALGATRTWAIKKMCPDEGSIFEMEEACDGDEGDFSDSSSSGSDDAGPQQSDEDESSDDASA